MKLKIEIDAGAEVSLDTDYRLDKDGRFGLVIKVGGVELALPQDVAAELARQLAADFEVAAESAD